MKSYYLFPHCCKWIGKAICVPSIIFGFVLSSNIELFNLRPDKWVGGYFDEIVLCVLIIALLLVAFSKEKIEDEYITKLRADSLIFALIANYVILIIGTCAIYGFGYLSFLFYNLFTPLLLYIFKFKIALYQFRKSIKDEE